MAVVCGVASVVIVAIATSAGLGASVANAASGTMVIKGYSSLASAAIVASTVIVDSGANAASEAINLTQDKLQMPSTSHWKLKCWLRVLCVRDKC